MDFADQMRRYFGADDLGTVPEPAVVAGIEHLQVDLGLERDRARRFALWTLLYTLNAAPDVDVTFNDPADRDAARKLMDMTDALSPPGR